jgi:hypothetical protein
MTNGRIERFGEQDARDGRESCNKLAKKKKENFLTFTQSLQVKTRVGRAGHYYFLANHFQVTTH